MISFSLACGQGHRFDAWFRSSDDYERQRAMGIVTCPACGEAVAGKALMAPSLGAGVKAETRPRTGVPDTGRQEAGEPMRMANGPPESAAELRTMLRALRQKVLSESENVGARFAEEARAIHFGDAQERGIYGEASREEVSDLLSEGIEIMPLPILPEDRN